MRTAAILSAISALALGSIGFALVQSRSTNESIGEEPELIRGLQVWPEDSKIVYPIAFGKEEWKKRLSEMEHYVLREKGTERAFTGDLNNNYARGVYFSAATGQPLFSSEAKFGSGTGWPSFFEPIDEDSLLLLGDSSYFMSRIEVVDSSSGSHLGHVFFDGPEPTGLRYCINSTSLLFVGAGEEEPPIVRDYRNSEIRQ